YTWNNTVRKVPFSWQPPNPDTSIELSPVVACFTPLHPKLCIELGALCGRVAVIPSCFQIVIIPLTVDLGIFSSKEISQMDLLHRWQPITVPRLNSLSSRK
ncbi:unnamed protein product, partial [Staurois parvus]